MSVLNDVLLLLKKEESRLQRELLGITAAIAAFGKTYVNGKSSRSLSPTGRPRTTATRKVPIKSKGTVSAAVGKKVAATQKARWSQAKAAKKSA